MRLSTALSTPVDNSHQVLRPAGTVLLPPQSDGAQYSTQPQPVQEKFLTTSKPSINNSEHLFPQNRLNEKARYYNLARRSENRVESLIPVLMDQLSPSFERGRRDYDSAMLESNLVADKNVDRKVIYLLRGGIASGLPTSEALALNNHRLSKALIRSRSFS
jgi:hypothetical protein